MRRKLFSLAVLLTLIVGLTLPFAYYATVGATPSAQVIIAGSGDGSWFAVYGDEWYGQTFYTPQNPFNVTSIKLYCRVAAGIPGNITVSIRNTTSGLPTGADLCSGTHDTSGWDTGYHEITMNTTPLLTRDTEYAIVARCLEGNAINYLNWKNWETGGLSTIEGVHSTNNGTNWTVEGNPVWYRDLMCQVWGEIPAAYPTVVTNNVTLINSSTVTVCGNLTDMGAGATYCNVSFEWDYFIGGNFSQETAVINQSANGTWQTNITLPVGGRNYTYRAKATNDLNNTYLGDNVSFEALPFPVTVIHDNRVDHQGLITHTYQRKAFYAAGRHWIIFPAYRDTPGLGRAFYWTSSEDGTDWGDDNDLYYFHEAQETDAEADELNVYFDGIYIHATYLCNRYFEEGDNSLYYRRGIPQTDGNITWSADWQTISVYDGEVRGYPSIVTDTSGHCYISYWRGAPSGHVWITKNSATNGTWSTASGYPVDLADVAGDPNMYDMNSKVLQLPDNKMCVLACTYAGDYGLGMWIYNGTSWNFVGAVPDTDALVQGYRYSATSRGNDIHLVIHHSGGTLRYTEYNGSNWSNYTTLATGLDSHDAPTLTVNGATGDVYVFWTDHASNYIPYKQRINGTWDGNATQWINESHYELACDAWGSGLSTHIGSYAQIYAGKIGVYYVTWGDKDVAHGCSDIAQYADLRFSFLEAEAGAAVRTDSATNINSSTGKLQGYLISDGEQNCSVRFQWGNTTSYGTNTTWQDNKTTGIYFNQTISGLDPSTTYYFHTQAKWADNTTFDGDGRPLTTTGLTPPTCDTDSATNVTYTTADLHGNLTSLGEYSPVNVSFQYGLTTGYGSNTTAQLRNATGVFEAAISSLSTNTTYHFRAKVEYNSSVYGTDMNFTTGTPPPPPPPPPPVPPVYTLASVLPYIFVGIAILFIIGALYAGMPLILVLVIAAIIATLGAVGTQAIVGFIENLW